MKGNIVYRLLSIVRRRHMPDWVKAAGLWAMHVGGRRVLGVFVDPVLGCNLRCRMCYFSDPAKRASMHGRMTDGELAAMAGAFYSRALKVQIGCGAEPSLDRRVASMVAAAKQAGVPYVSVTTNGQLYADRPGELEAIAAAGLDEVTLSMHGTSRRVYEHLMPGASYDRLSALLAQLKDIKARYPALKIRVNYTVNSMNMDDLRDSRFWDLWPQGLLPDIVQLRPVQKIGDTEWTDFDLKPLYDSYGETFGNIREGCRRRGIMCLVPDASDLTEVQTPQRAADALVEDLTYCYVAPGSAYKEDFDLSADTYAGYHRRRHTGRKLLRAVFRGGSGRDRRVTKKLNYRVRG